MGIFANSKEQSEELRGIKDDALPTLTNEQIILLALARFYEAEGIDDYALIKELYRRAGRTDLSDFED